MPPDILVRSCSHQPLSLPTDARMPQEKTHGICRGGNSKRNAKYIVETKQIRKISDEASLSVHPHPPTHPPTLSPAAFLACALANASSFAVSFAAPSPDP